MPTTEHNCDDHPSHLEVARLLRDEFGLPESSDAFTGENDGPTVEGDPTEYLGHVASWIVDTATDSARAIRGVEVYPDGTTSEGWSPCGE